MAKKRKKTYVKLACTNCKRVNYYTHISAKTSKLELKKYCSWCRKAILHKQAK